LHRVARPLASGAARERFQRLALRLRRLFREAVQHVHGNRLRGENRRAEACRILRRKRGENRVPLRGIQLGIDELLQAANGRTFDRHALVDHRSVPSIIRPPNRREEDLMEDHTPAVIAAAEASNEPVIGKKDQLEALAVNTIRFLAVDAVEKAKSGHPGTPMGMADMAYVLWTEFLHHDPLDPHWKNRDRFVLSAGHASMLLYSLLHLTGYPDMTLEELKNFRQWGSRTAGHPEYGHASGIETTTGPLGQGFAHAVGMGLAAKMLAARFNTADPFQPVDHFVYAICSDGDLMEGISAEAASIAGHLGLGNLIYFYDDNNISIEGETRLAFSEDAKKRFEAVGWHEQTIDRHDRGAIRKAIKRAQRETGKPSLIVARTIIGWESPKYHGTARAHGEPLGADEVKATKEALGWPLEPT